MPKSMLIDASHPEETRVVVVNDRQLEEFDFESSTKRQLKGNIYLAKVTRVEPSLQAAFVDYGGDRHGFLAFSEIHPDYYQLPQADRRLLEEAVKGEAEAAEADTTADPVNAEGAAPGEGESEAVTTDADEETEEVFAEQAKRRQRLLRNYKIQEVIKRRQIILVQVVKEERGNKGAALTTYLSLAGRYCVLMPNTARGGGISRKIANVKDRARLKTIARDLDVPEGMGLIVRTAGQSRNKLEIRRDYDYLLRLWSDIRDRTLDSIAPCTIHEEGALVKRAIRDIYDSDIGEILVEGEEGYKSAKKVMTMLMPSRARRIKQYKEELPLFHHFQIEPQLDALHSPTVELKSGGSIVINPTEALTSIDVNSGRATRERNIEETALKTNSEAAEEIARQLRLRDVAGLVVIDFIDMLEMRNQRIVERRLRDALRFDRARIQLGRISAFGLLELSRQRLRPSFLEMSTQPCPICAGSGTIRSVESAALQALRAVEIEGMKGNHASLSVTLPLPVALYLLNQKRDLVVSLEQRYEMTVKVDVGGDMIAGNLKIETVLTETGETEEVPAPAAAKQQQQQPASRRRRAPTRSRAPERVSETNEQQAEQQQAEQQKTDQQKTEAADGSEEDVDGQRRKRRRRRRRRRSGTEVENTSTASDTVSSDATASETSTSDDDDTKASSSAANDAKDSQETSSGEPGRAEMSGDDGDSAQSGRRRRRSSTRGRRRSSSSRRGSTKPETETNGSGELVAAGEPSTEEDAAFQNGNGSVEPRHDDIAEPKTSTPKGSATTTVEPSQVPATASDGATGNGDLPTSEGDEGFEGQEEADVQDTLPPREEAPSATAVMAAESSEDAEPRRGWWNRFVRK